MMKAGKKDYNSFCLDDVLNDFRMKHSKKKFKQKSKRNKK